MKSEFVDGCRKEQVDCFNEKYEKTYKKTTQGVQEAKAGNRHKSKKTANRKHSAKPGQ